ncbi:MAG TPA: hypothetical protein VGU67_02145 [Edaphobacter sp.]|nr:hypothetical protein [Edaphobacter sp.]
MKTILLLSIRHDAEQTHVISTATRTHIISTGAKRSGETPVFRS